MKKRFSNFLIVGGTAVVVCVGSAALVYFGVIDEYTAQILTLAAIQTIVALGQNLLTGFTGQLSLGHAGFMAIGGYVTAIAVMQFHLPLLAALVVGGLLTAFFGFLIGFPTLRLSGDYLAIVTLGFGEIIRVVMINIPKLTGGAAGLKGIPSFTKDIVLQPSVSLLWVFVVLALVIIALQNLMRSSVGRAIISVREDEIAANSMGINVFYYKMFAFVLSAFIAGLGGGLYAIFFGYLNPTMFGFLKSCDYVIIVVLGGMGSITGTVIAGFVLTYLQELLRIFKDYRLVIYPFLLIVIMLFRPSGLMGNRELRITKLRLPHFGKRAAGKEGA